MSYPIPPGTHGSPLPDTKEALRRGAERTVLTPSFIDDEEVERRWATITRPGYREHFAATHPEGRQHYLDISALADEELACIECPVLLMHGADDASFGPEKTSLVLQRKLARAHVMVLHRCGHSGALEHVEIFMDMVDLYFGEGRTARGRPRWSPPSAARSARSPSPPSSGKPGCRYPRPCDGSGPPRPRGE